MIENKKMRLGMVLDSSGRPLTIEPLPSPQISRWTARQKAKIVAAVNAGLLTTGEACSRYALSLEEFASWHSAIHRGGMNGLRTRRAQHDHDHRIDADDHANMADR